MVILLLGASLRLFHLDQESLWADETFTVRYTQSGDLSQLIEHIKTTEGAPFGHYLLLQYWIRIFGHSEFSVRFPSVIFGVLSISLLYLLGKKMFNEKVGVISALLLSTSMLQVLFSQEARLYAMYGFLALLSTYLLCFIIEREKKNMFTSWFYLWYGVVMIVAFYVNYLTFFLLLFHWLVLSLYKGQFSMKKMLYRTIVILLFAIPLLPLVKDQLFVGSSGLTEVLIKKGLPSFLASFGMFFYALPLILFFAAIEIIIYYKEKIIPPLEKLFSPYAFLSIITIFSTIYLYLVFKPLSLFGIAFTRFPITHSYFIIRHSYFLVPILYLTLAYGITSLKSRKIAMFCLGILLVTNIIALNEYYSNTTKAQWQEATEYLKLFGSQPILVDSGGPATQFSFDYYAPEFKEITKLTWLEGRRDVKSVDEIELFFELQNKKQFWLILTPAQKKGESFINFLNKNFQLDFQRSFYQLNLYHYTNSPLKNEQ